MVSSVSGPYKHNKSTRCEDRRCGYTERMIVWNMFGTVRLWARLGVVPAMLLFVGCARDVHLANREIPHVTVGPVTVDGVALDKEASPEAVAWAAIQAIRDDFKAATPQERDAALARQFDLCAANVIAKLNRSTLDRDEFIYNVVYRWTPTVSHYVDDFPADWEEARERFDVSPVAQGKRIDPEVEEVAVGLEVAPPGGDERSKVVMMIWLAKDSGFWRVVHLGFDQKRRSLREGASVASEGS